jgi:cysteinyl-tRNA synthetase
MLLYDSLSEKKKKVVQPNKGDLKLFVCGPTVYDDTHIGHARTYIVFDALVKYLRSQKIKIFYLQNITDIDDKIINRAKLKKQDPKELAQQFEKEYQQDMKALGINSVDKYARASTHMAQIKKQISTLIKKGFAYETDNGVYFEIKKFPRYGQLSKQNLNELRAGWRIEPDLQKKDPMDFALWKKTDMDWHFNSPWGKGRPGWHIEDTAISEKYLGSQYDLHGAAVDLKFPHHESEIAQQEAASGKKPFVKIWLHAGFLLVNGEKMSKSTGNFITIKDFLKKYPANVMRMIVLSNHYRSPINYTHKTAEQQQAALDRIFNFFRTVTLKKEPKSLTALIKKADKQFIAALESDFHTPKALAVIFSFISKAPKTKKSKQWISDKLKTLGFDFKIPKPTMKVNKMIKEREQLRQQKQYEEADKLRKKMEVLGFLVED